MFPRLTKPEILGFVFASLAFLQGVPTALAARDGELGPTSNGDFYTTLSIPPLFRISGVEDLTFDPYVGSGPTAKADDVCVWTNISGGNYSVKAQGEGTEFAYIVKKVGDITKTIPFSVNWNTTAGTGGLEIEANTPYNKTGANTQSTTCATGLAVTANFEVVFAESDLLAAKSGTYTGVLTIIIASPF